MFWEKNKNIALYRLDFALELKNAVKKCMFHFFTAFFIIQISTI